eukprot:2532872-Prymnesium_polylepis.1
MVSMKWGRCGRCVLAAVLGAACVWSDWCVFGYLGVMLRAPRALWGGATRTRAPPHAHHVRSPDGAKSTAARGGVWVVWAVPSCYSTLSGRRVVRRNTRVETECSSQRWRRRRARPQPRKRHAGGITHTPEPTRNTKTLIGC